MPLVRCKRGARVIEYGRDREIKYVFKADPHDPTKKNALCQVDDPEHLACMLADPAKFELADPESVPADLMAELGGKIAQKAADYARGAPEYTSTKPIAILSRPDEQYIDVVVRVSLEAYKAIAEDKTHEFAILPVEAEEPESHAGIGEIDQALLDELDQAAGYEQLKEIAKRVGAKIHHKWDDEKIRSAIREHVRPLAEAA